MRLVLLGTILTSPTISYPFVIVLRVGSHEISYQAHHNKD